MTQIIITLVAVVLLILVIGFFAMRYLRADDHDEFDDLPEERTTRSRGGDAADHDWRGDGDDRVVAMADHAGRGSKPGRRGGSNGGPDGRDRSGSGRAQQGRGASGRDDREPAGARRGYAGDRGFDDQGFDGPGFDTGGFDSRGVTDRGLSDRGLSDRGLSDRGFEGPGQDRGSRGGRGGERPQQPRPAAASARSGRGKGGDGPDWDSMSDIDYWTELASDKPLTTTAQPAGPTAARPGQDAPPDPRADRGSRPGLGGDGRADTGPWPAGARSGASHAGGSSRGGSALPDDSTALLPRRHAPTGPSPVLPAARAGAAAANADSLPSRGGRSAAQAARAAAPGRDTGRPAADPGSRGATYPNGRGGPAAGSGLSARGQDPRAQDASLSALARLGTPSGGPGGRQAPLDDDPLTSPSFPAIRSDDSRSYRRTDSPAGGGRGSSGSNGSRGPAGYGAPGNGATSNGAGASGNGIPPAQTAAYPTMSRPGGPDPRSAPAPGYESARSASRPASWEGGYGQQPPGGAVNGGAVNGGAVNGTGNGTGPNSYRPAAPAAGYQGYPEQPSSPPSGNPYGSYVSAPADSYQASRPSGDGGYGSYVNSAETQAYAQPPAAQAPMHAAPVYENGAPGGTAYPAAGGPAAGYGASWPGGTGYPGQGSAPAGYQGGSPGEPGYAAGHNGNGQHGNGHNGNGHNGAGHISSAGPYDHQSYLPPEGSGAAPDQGGYGGHDAGYGSGGYGNYPGY